MAQPAQTLSTSENTVSMRVLQGLIAAVEKTGIERGPLLRAAGIDPLQLEASDSRVPISLVGRACETAMDLTGDPALGLHWAERLTVNTFGPVSHLIAHAGSLRKGLESLAQFERLLTDDPGYAIDEHGETATLRCVKAAGESLRIQRFKAEMVLGSFFRILREFGGPSRLLRVSFDHPAPPYHAEYARVFGQPVRFDQTFSGIVFESAILENASPHKDDDMHQALQAIAERRLSHLDQRTPYALRVREILVREGGRERVDMNAVARELGVSVRTLRRRLAAEGKSYNDVESDALAVFAKHLLRDKQRTIQEAAYEMGFSDTTTFHRAFKRWTGMTPTAFRRSGLPG